MLRYKILLAPLYKHVLLFKKKCKVSLDLHIYESDQSYHTNFFFVCNDPKFISSFVGDMNLDEMVDAIKHQNQVIAKKNDKRQWSAIAKNLLKREAKPCMDGLTMMILRPWYLFLKVCCERISIMLPSSTD